MHGTDPMSAGEMHVHDVPEIVHAHAAGESLSVGKTHARDAHVHKCSACASCCLGAFLSSEPAWFENLELADGYSPLITGTLPAFLTPGIERPPRTFLA